jgi:hypothetical protein
MLGAAAIGLAQRLARGEDPDALAHDLRETMLAGFGTKIRTTFVASDCAFHTTGASTGKVAHKHA